MTDDVTDRPSGPSRPLAGFGMRNVVYLVFVVLLIPLSYALEAGGPKGPDAGGGIAFGLTLWAVVSLVFFLVNAVLAIVAGIRGRPAGPALIACALPPGIILVVMATQSIFPP